MVTSKLGSRSSPFSLLMGWMCEKEKKKQLKKFRLERLAGWGPPRWEGVAGKQCRGRTQGQVRPQVPLRLPRGDVKDMMVHENGAQRTG